MDTILSDINVCKIPIKISSYDEIFNALDYRDIRHRDINEEIDSLIDKSVLMYNKRFRDIKINLIINLPKDIYDENYEVKAREGIRNYYESYFQFKKKISVIGVRRITYYTIVAFILLTSWYLLQSNRGETFFSSLLNAGGTVLLWEIMSLVLIERKNFNEKLNIKKKILHMNIFFKYS